MDQVVDETNRLGPVVTEDQSASLSASVSVRYGRLTEVSGCVRCNVRLIYLALLPPALYVSAGGWSHRLGHRPEALGHPSFDSNGHD